MSNLILTEEELKEIEQIYGLDDSKNLARSPKLKSLFTSHRNLLSTNAELSFKNAEQRKTIDHQHILLNQYESMLNGGQNELISSNPTN